MSAVITTDRLTLRRIWPEDAPTITDLVNQPQIYRMVVSIPAHQTVAQTEDWIAKHPSGRETNTRHVLGIEQDKRLIGIVSGERKDPHLPFNVGYWLAPSAWGNGFMTEAAGALIQWLRDRGERAFVSGYLIDNPASGRVLEKLQFMKADRRPVFCMGRGERVDHFNMARVG
ncbi:GNAT family N-acetyltransferase [uncultured Hyphomonas sp.]|uniref:GNAT family N-acetyltransferase n=1 Tax=uncultured Hyphomonas sp. TaxID=225298 RepID=UPI002AAC2930|nr:GNAT family N-acetyltransferase [uncultured Hyphomonas sp.]